MDKKKLQTSGDFVEYIERLAEIAVREQVVELGLTEEDGIFSDEKPASKQKTAPKPAPSAAQRPTADSEANAEPNPYAAKPHPQEDMEEPTIDMVVDKLNSIRSGHSFRDTSVKGAMEQYFEKLSKDERKALLAFLKGLAQIVTGEVQGQAATDPNDKPAPGINMSSKAGDAAGTKTSGQKVTNVTVSRAQTNQKGIPASPKEDTRAPAPIKPKVR